MAATPKPLGVFGPTRASAFALSADTLRPLVGKLDRELRPAVAAYLRAGAVVLPIMEYTEDVLGKRFGVSGGSGVLTDGTYYWRGDAADYVETYGIGLDDEFVLHMMENDWSVPEVPEEVLVAYDEYLYTLLR
jgi:hypothetical protein